MRGTGPGIGFSLRVLWGPVAVLPAIPIYAAVLVRDGAPWRGDPMWTSECLALTLFMTAPLAAGISAIDASYVSQWSNAFLTGVASPAKRVYVWAGAWVALPLVALHAVAFALGVVVGRITAAELGLGPILATAVQGLALMWFCAVGSLIGRYSEPFIAGLAGAIAAFAITYTMGLAGVGADHRFSLLDVGGATVPQIGIVYSHSYLTWQSCIFVATALVIATLGIRYHNRRPQVVSLRMLMSMGVVIALLVLGQSLGPRQRKFPGDPSPPTECLGPNPTICLYREQRIWASTIDARLRRLADSARRAGYLDLAPPRIEQRSSSYRPTGDGVLSLRVDPVDLDNGQWFQQAMQSMLAPDCPQLHESAGPPERYFFDLRNIISTWSSIANLDPGDYGGGSVLAVDELHSVLSRWEVCNL